MTKNSNNVDRSLSFTVWQKRQTIVYENFSLHCVMVHQKKTRWGIVLNDAALFINNTLNTADADAQLLSRLLAALGESEDSVTFYTTGCPLPEGSQQAYPMATHAYWLIFEPVSHTISERVILAPSLTRLRTEVEAKKQLWQRLKKITGNISYEKKIISE